MRGGKKCVCLAKGKRENSFLKLSPVLPRPCLLSKLWSWQQGSSHVPCFAPHPKHTLKPRAGRLHSCAGQSPRGSAGGLAAKSQRGWKQTGLLPLLTCLWNVRHRDLTFTTDSVRLAFLQAVSCCCCCLFWREQREPVECIWAAGIEKLPGCYIVPFCVWFNIISISPRIFHGLREAHCVEHTARFLQTGLRCAC